MTKVTVTGMVRQVDYKGRRYVDLDDLIIWFAEGHYFKIVAALKKLREEDFSH